MPKFTENSGMTFAKKDISSAWNLPEQKLINTPAKHRPLGGVTCKLGRPLGQTHILFELTRYTCLYLHHMSIQTWWSLHFNGWKYEQKHFKISYRTHIDMEIWLVSPRGRRGPVMGMTAAMTWRFGCKNKIVFRIVLSNLSIQNRSSSTIWAFNKQN